MSLYVSADCDLLREPFVIVDITEINEREISQDSVYFLCVFFYVHGKMSIMIMINSCDFIICFVWKCGIT